MTDEEILSVFIEKKKLLLKLPSLIHQRLRCRLPSVAFGAAYAIRLGAQRQTQHRCVCLTLRAPQGGMPANSRIPCLRSLN